MIVVAWASAPPEQGPGERRGEGGKAKRGGRRGGEEEEETFDGIGGEEGEILGLDGILMREFGCARLWLRLAGQRGIIDLDRNKLGVQEI